MLKKKEKKIKDDSIIRKNENKTKNSMKKVKKSGNGQKITRPKIMRETEETKMKIRKKSKINLKTRDRKKRRNKRKTKNKYKRIKK